MPNPFPLVPPPPVPAPLRLDALLRALDPDAVGPLTSTALADLDAMIRQTPEALTTLSHLRGGVTLAQRIGEHGWDQRAHQALQRWPRSVRPMVLGALHAGHTELAMAILGSPHAPPDSWRALDDPAFSRPLVHSIVQASLVEVLRDWHVRDPQSLSKVLHQAREAHHPATLAWRARRPDVLRTLLEVGLPIDSSGAPTRYPGSTLLHEVAYHDWAEGVALLVAHGVDLNARNSKGRTALMLACTQQAWPVVIALIQAGADVSIPEHEGKQPLRYAVGFRGPIAQEAILRLLRAGADPDRPEGKTSRSASVRAWCREHRPDLLARLYVAVEQEVLRETLAQLPAPGGSATGVRRRL